MKALVNYGPGSMRYEDWAEPVLAPGSVLIEVGACGICGSDLHPYRGHPDGRPVPGVWGHEFAGTVLEVGPGVSNVAPGVRAAIQPLLYCGTCPECRAGRVNICANAALLGAALPGGFAERVAVPTRSVFPLPEGLDVGVASLSETLATPVHVFQNREQPFLRSVMIFGAGPQGLLCTQLARLSGAPVIVVCDVMEERLRMAREMGATHAIDSRAADPVALARELTAGRGVDMVIEAAGRPQTRQMSIAVVRRAGSVVFLATGHEATPLDFSAFVPREVRFKGTQCYTDADFELAVELLATGEVDVAPMITEVPLRDGAEAFERLVKTPGNLVKVILRP